MNSLPDDIVLEILGHLGIDTFFTARCVSKRIYQLATSRIGGLSSEVARTTFPGQSRVLSRRPGDVPGITFLNQVRYRQLAAILLECFKWRPDDDNSSARGTDCYLCADDPFGDALREKLELGLRVVAEISAIVKEVKRMPAELVRKQEIPSELDFCIGIIDRALLEIRRECMILARCDYYISQLCAEDLQGIKYIRDALLQYDTFEYAGKGTVFSPDVYSSGFELASWAAWTFIKMGPSVFWKIWWTNRENKAPQMTANRLLVSSGAHNSQNVRTVECEVFRRICIRFRKSESLRQIKSHFAMLGAPQSGFLLERQMTPLFLYQDLKFRIAPLYRERHSPTECTEREEIPSLLRGVASTSQTLNWNDFTRANPYVVPLSPTWRCRDELRILGLSFTNFINAVAYEQIEKEWLDREQRFGREERPAPPPAPPSKTSRTLRSIAARIPTKKSILRAIAG